MEIVQERFRGAVKRLQKEAGIKGFRPGHVPPHVIETKFGEEVAKEAIDGIISDTLRNALAQSGVKPVSRAHVEHDPFDRQKSFTYRAIVEVKPPLEIKDFAGIQLEKGEVKVDPDEVEQELDRLRQGTAQLEPVAEDMPLTQGLFATIDFEGKASGKAFQGSEAKDYLVELGTQSLLPEFETQLVGLKKGEERTIHLKYPKEYFNRDLSGKEAEFRVRLKEIRKKVVPELGDEFAKDLGNYENMEALRLEVSKRIVMAKENRAKNSLHRQLLEKMIAKNSFEVPESLVDGELATMIREHATRLEKEGGKLREEEVGELSHGIRPEAEFRVKAGLILEVIVKTQGLEVSEDEIQNALNEMAKAQGSSLAQIKAIYEKQGLLGPLVNQMACEKALEFALSQVRIKIKERRAKETK